MSARLFALDPFVLGYFLLLDVDQTPANGSGFKCFVFMFNYLTPCEPKSFEHLIDTSSMSTVRK